MARSRRTVVTASVQVHAAMVAVKPELEVKPDFEVVEAIESAGTEIASVESGAAMMSDGVVDTPSRAKGDPKAEYLPAHPGISARATDLPLPSLGYACLNCTLRHSKPTFFNNRTCRLATIQDPKKGIPFVSGLALQNCRDLLPILKWNVEHGIHFMRLSSEFFPWGNVHYKLCDLPDYQAIKEALAEAGEYARAHNHRLTTHPCEFVKLAGQTNELVDKSIADLELHSEMFDLLGYDAETYKHWNKVNIHVGGTYGDKEAAMERFAANFRKLSPACQLRLTVENDDRASMFSVSDLMRLHEMTDRKLPIVFDFHHYRFCPGGQTTEEALRSAMSTWPPGIRPVVHWSESQGGKRPHAHSDYIGQTGRMDLFGLDDQIDVMIESKAKELSLLLYRDIVEKGNQGRDEYFLSVDVIEEEAARVDQLKREGQEVDLPPVEAVVLEGVEIIPCNDKRLHGRSQRRNKAKRAAAAAAVKAEQADAAVEEGAEGTPVKTPRKRAPSKAAQAKAAAALAEAEGDAAGSPVSPSAASIAVVADLAEGSAGEDTKPAMKRKRAPSKAAQAKAAAALAEAENNAAGEASPTPDAAADAVAADDARSAQDAVAASASKPAPKRKRRQSSAAATAAAVDASAAAMPIADKPDIEPTAAEAAVLGAAAAAEKPARKRKQRSKTEPSAEGPEQGEEPSAATRGAAAAALAQAEQGAASEGPPPTVAAAAAAGASKPKKRSGSKRGVQP